MKTRIFFGVLIVALLAVMFWMDFALPWHGYFICLVAMGVTAVGLHELYAMARRVGIEPFGATGIAFGVVLLPYYVWSDMLDTLLGPQALAAFIMAPLLILVLVLMARAATRHEDLPPQFTNMAVTLFGVLYVALPMAFLVRTRFLEEGWYLVILVMGVSKASDIGAYFVGSLLGRHKLAKRVSPNKTIEGAVGGIVASVLAALLLGFGMNIRTLIDRGLLATIAFGVVVGVASEVGDLTESLIKRTTNTKDSGNLLPSFGGVLDLIDSFLIAAPVAYFVLSIFAKVTIHASER